MTHNINVPLARRVLAQITAAPERWTQDDWLCRPYDVDEQSAENTVENCRTAGCFAGWTVVLGGRKTRRLGTTLADEDVSDVLAWIRREGGYDDDIDLVRADATVKPAAAAMLGLTAGQADRLFRASNSFRDLVEYLRDWTDGEIERPPEWPEWADLGPSRLTEYWEAVRLGDNDERLAMLRDDEDDEDDDDE